MNDNNLNGQFFGGDGQDSTAVPEEKKDVFSSAGMTEPTENMLYQPEDESKAEISQDGFAEAVAEPEGINEQDAFEKKEETPEATAPTEAVSPFPKITPPPYQTAVPPAPMSYGAPAQTVPPQQSAPVQRPVYPQQQAPVQRPNPYAAPNNPNAQMPGATYNPYVANAASNQNRGYYNPNPYQQSAPYRQNNMPPAPPQMPYQPSGSSKGKIVAAVLVGLCVVAAIIFMVGGMLGFENAKGDLVGDGTSSQEKTTLQSGQDSTLDEPAVTDSMSVSTTKPDSSIPNSVYVADKVRPSVVGVMTYIDGELYGEGSGVLMSEKDGWTYVVTCAHVINEENVTYSILLLDGTTYEAELVAYDTRTDIGVVKVKKTGLPLAEFGDSSTLKVGEPIYAIGNPGGAEYFGSITDGIVASIDRSVTSTYTMTCIQHNAAINPGNSGGALVNTAGQVIGINSAKIASTEFEGMGFAVPTSIANPIVDALINYGYVPNRPKLGIEYAPVSSYQLYSIIVSVKGLPQGSLVIAGISEDSSLVGTDAQVNDLIIGVNGQDMDDASVLLDLIETGAVGDTLTLNLCRIDKRTYKVTTFDVTITLVEDRG